MEGKLKEIKDRFQEATLLGSLPQDLKKDMMWLIEQAEQVEALERQLENALFTDMHFEPKPKNTFKI